jgi:hypothetical protein
MSDVRYAFRLLRRDPGYTAVATMTMALGIGATTTLLSIAYGVLMKPLPWAGTARIMRVTESRKGQQARLKGTISFVVGAAAVIASWYLRVAPHASIGWSP